MKTITKVLLICGILSSLLYAGTDIFAAMQWEGYSYADHTVSELKAIGAPTRPMVVSLNFIYDMLLVAFGLGIWTADKRKRARIMGTMLIGCAVAGQTVSLFFPMNLRGVETTISDTIHIVLTMVNVLFILLSVGFGAGLNGKRFLLYSVGTILIMLLFGIWAGADGQRIAAQLPTPWVGIKERINIYSYLLWVMVLAMGYICSGKKNVHAGSRDMMKIKSTTMLI